MFYSQVVIKANFGKKIKQLVADTLFGFRFATKKAYLGNDVIVVCKVRLAVYTTVPLVLLWEVILIVFAIHHNPSLSFIIISLSLP